MLYFGSWKVLLNCFYSVDTQIKYRDWEVGKSSGKDTRSQNSVVELVYPEVIVIACLGWFWVWLLGFVVDEGMIWFWGGGGCWSVLYCVLGGKEGKLVLYLGIGWQR